MGQCGCGCLSQVTSKLDTETVKSILDGVTVGMTERVDAHDPAVAEAGEDIHYHVWETAVLARATHAPVYLHVTDWVTTQQEDPILKTMIKWISNQWVQDLKHCWMMAKHWGGKSYPSREEKAGALPGSPLPLPYTSWQIGRSFVVHGPHGLLSCCHEWMSLRCWTSGSAANSVPTTRPVLVAQNGHAEAEGH